MNEKHLKKKNKKILPTPIFWTVVHLFQKTDSNLAWVNKTIFSIKTDCQIVLLDD